MSARAYSDAVLDHLRRPRGAGAFDEREAVATGEAGDSDSGRLVRLQLRIADGRVEEARFKAFGCAATIAAASWLTERVAGLAAGDAARIDADEVCAGLELDDERRDAAGLALRALRAALAAAPDVRLSSAAPNPGTHPATPEEPR